jgi:hypothetical protein
VLHQVVPGYRWAHIIWRYVEDGVSIPYLFDNDATEAIVWGVQSRAFDQLSASNRERAVQALKAMLTRAGLARLDEDFDERFTCLTRPSDDDD